MDRCHCTIKHIATRMWCSMEEAVHLYIIMPKDNTSTFTALANSFYIYQVGVKGIDFAFLPVCEELTTYKMGELVWWKALHYKFMSKFGKGVVTGSYNLHSVLANGMLPHIKYLHFWPEDWFNSKQLWQLVLETLDYNEVWGQQFFRTENCCRTQVFHMNAWWCYRWLAWCDVSFLIRPNWWLSLLSHYREACDKSDRLLTVTLWDSEISRECRNEELNSSRMKWVWVAAAVAKNPFEGFVIY